jgi:dihydrofolate reductase
LRKIVASFFMALDGVVEAPQNWHFPYQDEEMFAAMGDGMASADAILLGRKTYEEWASYWPHQGSDVPMADYINNLQKYVVSMSLDGVEWQNSTLLSGPPLDAIGELKRQPGKGILVNGSGTLVKSLLDAKLIDELRIILDPIVVGTGRRLFEGGREPRGLTLVESNALGSGVLSLTYRPAA